MDRFNSPPELEPIETQLVIKRFVDEIKHRFDAVLIDNPPNLQMCTYSSLPSTVKPKEKQLLVQSVNVAVYRNPDASDLKIQKELLQIAGQLDPEKAES